MFQNVGVITEAADDARMITPHYRLRQADGLAGRMKVPPPFGPRGNRPYSARCTQSPDRPWLKTDSCRAGFASLVRLGRRPPRICVRPLTVRQTQKDCSSASDWRALIGLRSALANAEEVSRAHRICAASRL